MLNIEAKRPSWLDRPLSASVSLSWETAVFVVILVLAFASRFYDLQARVMSHDENSHVYYSWLYYEGMPIPMTRSRMALYSSTCSL